MNRKQVFTQNCGALRHQAQPKAKPGPLQYSRNKGGGTKGKCEKIKGYLLSSKKGPLKRGCARISTSGKRDTEEPVLKRTKEGRG